MHALSWGFLVLGAAACLAGIALRLARDLGPARRWTDSWSGWLLRGAVFLLAGFGGFAPGPGRIALFLAALGLMAASAIAGLRWKRRTRSVA